MEGVNFSEARFDRAHLDGIDFRNSNIFRAYFADARIGGANFTLEQIEALELTIVSLLADESINFNIQDITYIGVFRSVAAFHDAGFDKFWSRIDQIRQFMELRRRRGGNRQEQGPHA